MTTYYRNRLTLTVLSDRPIEGLDIGYLLEQCDTGDMVLGAVDLSTDTLDRAGIDAELIAAGSDPGFYSDDDESDPWYIEGPRGTGFARG